MPIAINKQQRPSPWVVADRSWFKEHKTRDWYVRDAMDGEVDELSFIGHAYTLQCLKELALSPGAPARTRIRVCVFQIIPGSRYRIPVLGQTNSNSESVIFISRKDKKLVSPVEWLAELREMAKTQGFDTMAGVQAELLRPDDYEHPSCSHCKKDFTSPFVHAIVDCCDGFGTVSVCGECVPGLHREGRGPQVIVVGFGVWAKPDEDLEKVEFAAKMASEMSRLMSSPVD